MLFSKGDTFKNLKDPSLYANYFDDVNYWKLYYLFGGEFKPPDNPHPLLGWIGDFGRGTLMHNKIEGTQNKRPVLLYGDSYAQCVTGVECFQDILNRDTAFVKNHFLLNYGVGGYGVDQIQLLFKNTAHHYKNPFVIFSVMVSDLDRTIMPFRTGQKPYYKIENDSLILQGVPIDSNPANYIQNNPPNIKSYLWRKFLYSDVNFLPSGLDSSLKHIERTKAEKLWVNGVILKSVIDELRNNNIDFMFVVFHYIEPGNNEFSVDNDEDWRDKFLKDFLESNKVQYVWSKELIRKDGAYNKTNIDKYMILENGHPTSYFNGLIADRMKDAVLENEALHNYNINWFENKAKNDNEWLTLINQKAVQQNRNASEVLKEEAEFVLLEKIKKENISPSLDYLLSRINTDATWKKTVEEKALAAGVSFDQQAKKEAEFMVGLNNQKEKTITHWTYSDRINQIVLRIKSDSAWYKMAYDKSVSTNTPIETVLFNEAAYVFNKENENNKTFPLK